MSAVSGGEFFQRLRASIKHIISEDQKRTPREDLRSIDKDIGSVGGEKINMFANKHAGSAHRLAARIEFLHTGVQLGKTLYTVRSMRDAAQVCVGSASGADKSSCAGA